MTDHRTSGVTGPDHHAGFADRYGDGVVTGGLTCRTCGYELTGLAASGLCPECGTSIWTSVLREIDPASSHLPQLGNPQGVGRGLLVLTLLLLAGGLLLAVGPVTMRLAGLGWIGDVTAARVLAVPTVTVAAILGVGIVWPAWLLLPQRDADRSSRDVRLLAVGGLGWAAAMGIVRPVAAGGGVASEVPLVLGLAMAAIVLFGLRGVLRAVGDRSRAYRRSQHGRQSSAAMVAAIGALMVGIVASGLAERGVLDAPVLVAIADVITWINGFMLLLGFAYLVLNAAWIHRSLVQPPRSIDEILTTPSRESPPVAEA